MPIKNLPTFTALALIEMFKSLKNDFMSKREANWLMAEPGEKLPISEFYKVVDYVTIFRSEKWWEAIVIFESFGKRSIGLYLWQNRNGTWKRKHKFNIRNLEEWNKLKNAIDQLAPKLISK